MSRPLVPDTCASYAKSFHSVVDQIKRFNGMALTYPGIDAERNRLRFYQQMNKKLAPLISCLEDHEKLDFGILPRDKRQDRYSDQQFSIKIDDDLLQARRADHDALNINPSP